MRIMLKTYAGRMAAGAVISAALTAGSLGLTATAAGACTTPDCLRGVPAAAPATGCSEPSCLSGTRPAAAPRPGSLVTGRTGHGGPGARAAGGAGTAASAAWVHAGASTAITCPWWPPDGCPAQRTRNHRQVSRPAAAPRPGSLVTGRTGHGGPGARAAGGAGTAASAAWVHAGASTAITCPWYPPDCPDFGQASAQVSGWR